MGKIVNSIKLLLALLFFSLALSGSLQVQRSAEIITVLLESGGLSGEEAEAICRTEAEQEDSQYVCFWGEVREAELSCRETGDSARVTMVLTRGNPELVVPGTEAMVWQEKGCYIDTETASELFGTTEAAGQLVWWSGHAYTVCGTFESLRQIMIRTAGAEDGQALTGVSLCRPREGNRKSGAEQFLLRNGLSGKQMNFIFLNALLRDLLLLPPLILAFRLISILIPGKRIFENHPSGRELPVPADFHTPGQAAPVLENLRFAALRGLLALLLAGAVLWLLLSRLEIPADMIPTKWSDFSFWTSWWKEQRQNLLLLMETAQGERQLSALWSMLQSLLCDLLSLFFLLGFHLR